MASSGSDNYEFMKTNIPQGINEYSPYIDKQYNGFINDLNSAVYTNTSLSLVQFDLGQIYNSQKYTNTEDLFLVIPITMAAAFSTGSAPVAPVAGNSALLTMKNNFVNLIHQADLQINGKTIESTQPYINIAKNFQMLSEMSISDLATIGYTLGFSDTLDNPRSVIWNSNLTNTNGNGFTNNRPFIPYSSIVTGQGAGARIQTSVQATQNKGTINDSISYKVSRYADVSAGGQFNAIYGNNTSNIMSLSQLTNEFRPTYQVLATNYMVWYDYAVIKLSTVFESLGNIGLIKKFDCTLRLWINTGTLNVTVVSPNTTTPGYSLTTANNTFTNTVPITVNYLNDVSANGGIPTTTTNIVAGLFINKPPSTSLAGINLQASGASHPMPACRIYFSQIQLNPEKSLKYIETNRNKRVCYRTILANQYNNVGAGNSVNQLINSGIVHPTGILIVPYISSQLSGAFGDYAWKSPFDTCPSTGHPISLINLQVSVGGVNQLQSTLNYNYENFIEQVNLAEQLTSSDFGVTVGLFNQQFWEMSKMYFVNIERAANADKITPRNINISFVNNTNVPIDYLTFIWYSDQITIDIESGLVTKVAEYA